MLMMQLAQALPYDVVQRMAVTHTNIELDDHERAVGRTAKQTACPVHYTSLKISC